MVWDVDFNKLLELVTAIYELNKVFGDVERLDELVNRLLDTEFNISLDISHILCFDVIVEKVPPSLLPHDPSTPSAPFKEEELKKGAVEICNGKLKVFREYEDGKMYSEFVADSGDRLTLRGLLYLYYLEVFNPGLFNRLIEKGKELSKSLEELRKLLEQVKGVVELSSK